MLKNPLDRHVVVDCETTGLWPRHGHRVIEIGAVAIENRVVVGEFATLIDAGVSIPPEVQAIHGITDEMLEGRPPPEEILPRFYDFIRESILVAHNAAFDIRFLRHEFARLGMGLPHPHVCTLEMSRRRFPRLADYTLETIYLHLFPDPSFLRQNHRALDDARMTAKIWMKMEGG
ncbi:MAG: 3'-5' exonuclease [Proteobacteria bacterium]|nr:3'-5' exonuclease [Pseudomonadota bacterium]MBU2261242.1 3'-5' exonuclease [Pseudomonadota bacterium]